MSKIVEKQSMRLLGAVWGMGIWMALGGGCGSVYAGDPPITESALPASASVCGSCHGGQDGVPLAPIYPKIHGQGADYLLKQLRDMKTAQVRKNPLMDAFLAPMTDSEMQIIAAYYAQQKPHYGVAVDKALAEKGRQIYMGGIPQSAVPACAACHGPAGEGKHAARFPAVAGQNAAYVVSVLKAFRGNARSNDPNRMMRSIANNLTNADMEAVAAYIQGLQPADPEHPPRS